MIYALIIWLAVWVALLSLGTRTASSDEIWFATVMTFFWPVWGALLALYLVVTVTIFMPIFYVRKVIGAKP